MSNKDILKIEKICELYEVPTSFIDSLEQYELIQVTIVDDQQYIKNEDLPLVEKFIRLHYDLEINLEGIDVVNNLLNKIDLLQQEILDLQRKLNYYKAEF